jgi:hypothetical protein
MPPMAPYWSRGGHGVGATVPRSCAHSTGRSAAGHNSTRLVSPRRAGQECSFEITFPVPTCRPVATSSRFWLLGRGHGSA